MNHLLGLLDLQCTDCYASETSNKSHRICVYVAGTAGHFAFQTAQQSQETLLAGEVLPFPDHDSIHYEA